VRNTDEINVFGWFGYWFCGFNQKAGENWWYLGGLGGFGPGQQLTGLKNLWIGSGNFIRWFSGRLVKQLAPFPEGNWAIGPNSGKLVPRD